MKKKVAIVVQRYGEQVVGGAEGLARDLAEHMVDDWDLTVITTCAQDYRSWANAYKEGQDSIRGVRVLRFPVDSPRDFDEYSRVSYQNESKSFRLSEEQESKHFEDQGPFVPKLVNYLDDHYHQYDVFLFFTYLYYTSVFGIPKVANKAYLLTTAHDEPPFYFARTYEPIFKTLKGIIYLAEEERDLINRIYDLPATVRQIKGGYGVPEPAPYTKEEEEGFRNKFAFIRQGPHYLYVGRASHTKRCQEMIDAYIQMTGDYKLPAQFAFAGVLDLELPESRTDMVSLGYVTEKEKSFLIRNAICVINPSSLESLSMIILESWQHGTPVIVNGESQVMRGLCDRSGAGLYYYSMPMFKGLLAWAYQHRKEGRQLGRLGKRYVQSNFNWRDIKSTLLREIV